MKNIGLLAMAAGLCLAFILLPGPTNVNPLSTSRQAQFWGGAQYCLSDGCKTNCECQTHDCSDIECTTAWMWDAQQQKWVAIWAKGNDGDTDDVTTCYKKTDPSASCTWGNFHSTNCEGDVWKTAGCFGDPDYSDKMLAGNDCT